MWAQLLRQVRQAVIAACYIFLEALISIFLRAEPHLKLMLDLFILLYFEVSSCNDSVLDHLATKLQVFFRCLLSNLNKLFL